MNFNITFLYQELKIYYYLNLYNMMYINKLVYIHLVLKQNQGKIIKYIYYIII